MRRKRTGGQGLKHLVVVPRPAEPPPPPLVGQTPPPGANVEPKPPIPARAAAASRRAAAAAWRLVGGLWGLAETVLWLVFMAALVSAGIWVAYLVGKQAGWSHPALAWAAGKAAWFWGEVYGRVVKR